MKLFLCCALLAAVVSGEPPRYRSARFELQRQEREPTTPPPADAPYPAAGWRPAKQFALPSRQAARAPPATSYGTPLDTYAAPQSEYGAPTEAPAAESTTAADETTTAGGDVESLKVKGLTEEQSSRQTADVQSNEGAYYVLLPNSRLQRVDFKTENDLANMAYTARLQYRDENQAPIYVYTGGVAPAAAYAVPQSAAYAVPQSAAYAVPQSAAYAVPQSAAYGVPQSAAYAVQQTAAYALPQTAGYVRYI